MSHDQKLQVRTTETGVLYILNGQSLFGGPVSYEVADQIARESTRCARLYEERVKANEIIMDNALMQRAGANIGLSDNPKIKAETIKEALYNRELRRHLPSKDNMRGIGGIQSRGAVGAPSLFKRSAT
jgi:hypothetical protein